VKCYDTGVFPFTLKIEPTTSYLILLILKILKILIIFSDGGVGWNGARRSGNFETLSPLFPMRASQRR
jgi:hypothetical protein